LKKYISIKKCYIDIKKKIKFENTFIFIKMDIHKYCKDKNITLDELQKLLTCENVNLQDNDGWTPMHCLCVNRSITLTMLEFAISLGGELKIKNNLGATPMPHLWHNTSITLPMLKFSIIHGGEINIKDNNGYTLMHELCWNRSITVPILEFSILNLNGGELNIQNIRCYTPMYFLHWNKSRGVNLFF
jgi:ankyrin repeat protein